MNNELDFLALVINQTVSGKCKQVCAILELILKPEFARSNIEKSDNPSGFRTDSRFLDFPYSGFSCERLFV